MLTRAERLALWNQYEILKRLDPDNKKEYETKQEILSNGYEQYYSEINPSIYEETVVPEVSQEVEEILNLFSAIKSSCQRLGYKPKSPWAEFQGFDGNDDGGHYRFAKFVRRTLGKWNDLADQPDNSHSGMSLSHYRAMVKVWRQLGGGYELTADQIEQIADAR